MANEKIEAIEKSKEPVSNNNANMPNEADRVPPNKEHFNTLINSSNHAHNSFEVVSTAPPKTESIEKNPFFNQDSTSAQKSGSATDQERKGKQQQETDEIDGVSATGSKKSVGFEATNTSSTRSINAIQSSSSSSVDPASISKQIKTISTQIDSAKNTLSNVKDIKPSYQNLLRNQLTHVDDNLRIASSKFGSEQPPVAAAVKGEAQPTNSVVKFIDNLTSSQKQLVDIQQSIEKMSASGKALSPGDMLAVQIKMNYVQQQMELFTNMLNKALEATKTVMNVQV